MAEKMKLIPASASKSSTPKLKTFVPLTKVCIVDWTLIRVPSIGRGPGVISMARARLLTPEAPTAFAVVAGTFSVKSTDRALPRLFA